MRDVSSGNDDCSDNRNGNSNDGTDSGNGDSGDNDNNSDSGGSDSDSGGEKNNQLKVALAVGAALASILLAS